MKTIPHLLAAFLAIPLALPATSLEGETEGAAPFSELEEIRVSGIRWIPDDHGAPQRLRAFNFDPGLTFAVFAKFPEPVTEVSEVQIRRALTPTDVDLVSQEQRHPFFRLSDDKKAVAFEVQLRSPEEPADALKEFSGVLVCRVSAGTMDEDLGFARLALGEKGSLFSAKLSEAPQGWGGEDEFNLELRINASEIAGIRFTDAEGDEIEVTPRGSMVGGNQATYTFAHEEPLPEDGKVLLIRHRDLQTFEVPFQLENVSLVPGG